MTKLPRTPGTIEVSIEDYQHQRHLFKTLLSLLKAAAPYVPVEIQGKVINAINEAEADT